ncbi:MAG TPA: hypothetical protein PKM73_00955 [Verrucomicrobiota bacterium]|nr:hypothetical protein [Verrucomicrobiota bacterium]HNU53152.1 hypothetical protein [Verrucomicrobiota bacterium]
MRDTRDSEANESPRQLQGQADARDTKTVGQSTDRPTETDAKGLMERLERVAPDAPQAEMGRSQGEGRRPDATESSVKTQDQQAPEKATVYLRYTGEGVRVSSERPDSREPATREPTETPRDPEVNEKSKQLAGTAKALDRAFAPETPQNAHLKDAFLVDAALILGAAIIQKLSQPRRDGD